MKIEEELSDMKKSEVKGRERRYETGRKRKERKLEYKSYEQ